MKPAPLHAWAITWSVGKSCGFFYGVQPTRRDAIEWFAQARNLSWKKCVSKGYRAVPVVVASAGKGKSLSRRRVDKE